MSRKNYIQFDLSPAQMESLERLMKQGSMANRKELFDTALTLLKWVLERTSEGCKILALNPDSDSYRQLDMSILDYSESRGLKKPESLLKEARKFWKEFLSK